MELLSRAILRAHINDMKGEMFNLHVKFDIFSLLINLKLLWFVENMITKSNLTYLRVENLFFIIIYSFSRGT